MNQVERSPSAPRSCAPRQGRLRVVARDDRHRRHAAGGPVVSLQRRDGRPGASGLRDLGCVEQRPGPSRGRARACRRGRRPRRGRERPCPSPRRPRPCGRPRSRRKACPRPCRRRGRPAPRSRRRPRSLAGELGRDPAVDLAARVAVEIEGAPLRQVRERVGARGDGLRLQRLGRPARRHLRRDDALQIRLEPDACRPPAAACRHSRRRSCRGRACRRRRAAACRRR